MSASKKTRYLTQAALIAALYVVLTAFSALLGLSGTAAVQLRVSEALCILPYFTPAAIPGLAIGCLLSNLLTGAHVLDIVFGTLATLLGALGSFWLRRRKWLVPIPPILSNTLIVPFVLRFAYFSTDMGWGYLFLTVFAGEALSVGVLGTLLLLVLERYRQYLFR